MAKAQADGGAFEREIAHLYEALGYRVMRDVLLDGQQVDLLAEKYEPEVGQRRILIECKYLESGSVSNQTVHDFISTYIALSTPHRLTGGVLVTNSSFTRFAKKAAERAPIVLRTREELERGAINSTDAAYLYVKDYENRPIFAHYVPLEATSPLPQFIADHLQSAHNGGIDISTVGGIERPLVALLQAGPPCFLTILADFGAGKTSLLQRLKYELCKQLLAGELPRTRIPVIFHLRDLPKYVSLEAFIVSTLNHEFGHAIPLHVFWKYLESGSIVPLLDGFDEAATYTDSHDRRELILRLSPLINRSAAPAVLTCRPSFFVSPDEYQNLLIELSAPERRLLVTTTKSERSDLQRVQKGMGAIKNHLFTKYLRGGSTGQMNKTSASISLRVFDRKRIAGYLKRRDPEFQIRVNQKWWQVYRFLHRVYDLTDLMSRPFLLEMIAETVLYGQLDLHNRDLQIGASGLYETYTGIQLEAESTCKNRTLFDVDERRYLAHLLALTMHKQGYGGVTFESISDVVLQTGSELEEFRQKLLAAGEEAAASDTAVCAFLSRREDGRFYFAHKSFMEFFLARQVRTSLELEECDRLMLAPLSAEVLYFLGSMIGLDEKLKTSALELYGRAQATTPEGRVVRSNVLGALCYIVIALEHQFLSEGLIANLVLNKVSWRSTRARNIQFDTVNCAMLSLTECVLDSCKFQRSKFRKMVIAESAIDATLAQTTIDEIQAKNRTTLRLQAKEGVIEKLHLEESQLHLHGRLLVNAAIINNSEVVVNEDASESQFLRVKFTRTKLILQCKLDSNILGHETVSFDSCVVVGIPAVQCIELKEPEQLDRLSVAQRFTRCSGVVFFDRSDVALSRAAGDSSWIGDLCLVNLTSMIDQSGEWEQVSQQIESRLGVEVATAATEAVGIYRARLKRQEAH